MSFPAITPTSRKFTAPRWPTKAFVSQSGTTTRRLYGSLPSQADLQLTYRNITDEQAGQIVDHYQSLKGPMTEAGLPSETWIGAGKDLKKFLNLVAYGPQVKWYFAGAPTVDSIFPGVSTVQVKLIGEIRD